MINRLNFGFAAVALVAFGYAISLNVPTLPETLDALGCAGLVAAFLGAIVAGWFLCEEKRAM